MMLDKSKSPKLKKINLESDYQPTDWDQEKETALKFHCFASLTGLDVIIIHLGI